MEGVEFGSIREETFPLNVTNLYTHVHIRVPPFLLCCCKVHTFLFCLHTRPFISL